MSIQYTKENENLPLTLPSSLMQKLNWMLDTGYWNFLGSRIKNPGSWIRRGGKKYFQMKILILSVMLNILLAGALHAGVTWDVNKGNRLYKKGKYNKAGELYETALQKKENNRVHYNLGNVNYQQQDFVQAEEEYKKSIGAGNTRLKQKASYNLGNAYYSQGRLKEAVDFWKKSLILDPEDEAARNNMELGLKMLKQQQQQKKEKSKDKQDKKSEQDKKEQEKKEEEREKEEVRRILDMMENMEKEARKKKQFKIPKINVEKDW